MIKTNKNYNDTNKRNEIIFITTIMILPIITFILLYICVNFNMIVLAFKRYDINTGKYYFDGFNNFIRFFKDMGHDSSMHIMLGNSFMVYFLHLIIGMPISILVSYAVYKNIYGSGIFRVLLFLPTIISSIVWVLIFKYAVEYALPAIMGSDGYVSLLINPKTSFPTMLFYYLWLGVPGNFILYTGAMSRVPVTLVEYGKLDGLGGMKELFLLTIPLIFPTITVFIVTGFAGIFSNQLNLYAFYGSSAPTEAYTYGYYLFIIVFGSRSSLTEYPYSAAAGLVFTLIVLPVTLLIRYLLEKFGPSAEY